MDDSPSSSRRRNHPWRTTREASNYSYRSANPPIPSNGSSPAITITPVAKQQKTAPAWLQLWSDIERTLGLHGVRRVKPKRRSIFASIVWILLILAGMALSSFAVVSHIRYYLSFPKTWTVDSGSLLNEPGWPGISVCNLSPIRLEAFYKTYMTDPNQQFNWTRFLETSKRIGSRDFYTNLGHPKHDMLIKCRMQGSDCYFLNSPTLTSDGVCYTIKPEITTEFVELWLNAETYNSFSYLEAGVGFKIYVHERDEVPLDTDHFFYAVPGYAYDATFSKERLSLLPFPYGDCLDLSNSLYNQHCHARCIFNIIEEHCQCTPFFASSTGKKQCDFWTHYTCVQGIFKEKDCSCDAGCQQLYYSTKTTHRLLTNAELSSYFTEEEKPLLLSKYSWAVDITSKMQANRTDNSLVTKFNASCSNLIAIMGQFSGALHQFQTNLSREKYRLEPRIHFHSKIALEGLRSMVRKGFSSHWLSIEEGHFPAVTQTSVETILVLDRTIATLKTSTDAAVRRFLFVRINDLLDIRMNAADRLLSNVTVVYKMYLSAEPHLKERITTGGRYDDVLVPRLILSAKVDTINAQYNLLAGKIGKYIESLANFQNLLRDVYASSRLNEEILSMWKTNFLNASVEISQQQKLFKHQVVLPVEDAMDHKVNHFKEKTQAFHSHMKMTNAAVHSLRQYLHEFNRSKIEALLNVEHSISTYSKLFNLTKSDILAAVVADDFHTFIDSLQEIPIEVTVRLINMFALLEETGKATLDIWKQLLTEESLNSFYFRLNSDLTEMQRDSTRTSEFLQIFCDEKMLNISQPNRTALLLRDLATLLNADIPVLNMDHKNDYFTNTIQNLIDTTNYKTVVHQQILKVQRAFKEFYQDLVKHQSKLKLDETFYRSNLLKVKLQHQPNYLTHWQQKTATSMLELLTNIGVTFVIFLGCSVLTLLEFCDIIITWLMNRECCDRSRCTPPKEDIIVPKRTNENFKSFDQNRSLDVAQSRHYNRTPSSDSVQSRDNFRDSKDSTNKRPFVKFQDGNHIRGSEV